MATAQTLSREPGSSYDISPSLSPSRSHWTFSAQRAEFTKPVPPGLRPIYPDFPRNSDSSDEPPIIHIPLTGAIVTPQGQRANSSTAKQNQDVDRISMGRQATLVRGYAEKSGISPIVIPASVSHRTASLDNLDRSLKESNDMKAEPERDLMGKIASFLGLQKRQQDRAPIVITPLMESPFPAHSPSKEQRYSPFPSPSRSRSDSDSSLLPNNTHAGNSRNTSTSTVIEDNREMRYDSSIELGLPERANEQTKLRKQGNGPAKYPLPVSSDRLGRFSRHSRSRSLDIGLAAQRVHTPCLLPFSQEDPPLNSRSRSMDCQSRCGRPICLDGTPWHSSSEVYPLCLPPDSMLVQVWAVGLDESDRLDSNSCAFDDVSRSREPLEGREGTINHSISSGSMLLGWSLNFEREKKENEPRLGWLSISSMKSVSTPDLKHNKKRMVREVSRPKLVRQRWEAGHVPGQSFLGRVLESGSGVDRSFATKDDCVIGLIDIRRCGSLAEFIVIDWRQVYRVPVPYEFRPLSQANSSRSTLVSERPSSRQETSEADGEKPRGFPPLTFDQLALLPLCGIPAYRAVNSCMAAFPAEYEISGVDGRLGEQNRQRRALVLRGHDGVGAMSVQMLVRQGWRVSVHVPFSRVPWDANQAEADEFMLAIEDRLRKWGVDEVIYDDANTYATCDGEMDDRKAAVVRVIETFRADGDVFDAILDFVGGMEIWEAGERLLRQNGGAESQGIGQFTTFLGDAPDDLPVAGRCRPKVADSSTLPLHGPRPFAKERIGDTKSRDLGRTVEYTQIRGVFESEDEDIWDILRSVLRFSVEDGIRPHVEEVGGEIFGRRRVVSLERASDVLMDGDLLSDGGLAVVRVV